MFKRIVTELSVTVACDIMFSGGMLTALEGILILTSLNEG